MPDTPLGKNALIPSRARECMPDGSIGEFPRLGAPEVGLPEPYVFVNSVLRAPIPDALHIELSRAARSTVHR